MTITHPFYTSNIVDRHYNFQLRVFTFQGSLRDGRQVAVKRTSIQSPSCKEEFENEVRFVAVLQHVNIVKLVGCCSTKTESFHVYEFMQNGSLHDHIHGMCKQKDIHSIFLCKFIFCW